MTSYAPACDPMTIRSDLLSALDSYIGAHMACEVADREYRRYDAELSEAKTAIAAEVAKDKAFSNDTLRKAELQLRLEVDHSQLLLNHDRADTARRAAQAELERAEAHIKTLRAVLYFDAEQARLHAEQIAANRLAAQMDHVGGPDDDDLPF